MSDHKKRPDPEEVASAMGAFLAELSAFAPEDAKRIEGIDNAVAKGDPDGDPTWFARFLTEKQIRYGLAFMSCEGDWRLAAAKAGYAPSAQQVQIEGGPAMLAYMTAIKAFVMQRQMVTAELVAGRLNRLALASEQQGKNDAAIRANIALGNMLGLFDKKAPSIHINADGAVINIGMTRSREEDDDEAIEATYREIMDGNQKALPGGDS